MFPYVRQRAILSATLLMFALAAGGCMHGKPQKTADMEILKEEVRTIKQTAAETDKKLAEICSHFWTLQAKADSNSKKIDTLKTELASMAVHKEPATPQQTAPKEKPPVKQALPKPSRSPGPASVSPEKAYENACAVFKKGLHKNALSLFSGLLDKYPSHYLADNTQYWIGECYYTVNDYKASLKAFQKVIDNYPDGNKVPDALLKAGLSCLGLEDHQNARTFLKKVIRDYPFNPAAESAEIRLRAIEELTD